MHMPCSGRLCKKAVNGSKIILFIVLALKGCQAGNLEAIP